MSDAPATNATNGAVPVVTADGKAGYLPAALANDPAALEGLRRAGDRELRGAQVAANQDATKAALDAQFSGSFGAELEGAVAPVLAGAARGLTLGGSDSALSELGEPVRRRLLDYQEYAPIGSAAGEIGAIAGAALLGDEAGLGALPNAVGRLGGRAGLAVTEGLGGGLLARGAGVLARGATEGAIYSTGKAAADAALRDEKLTAEQAVAAAGHGALFGAGANALFAGAGHALESLGGLRAPTARLAEAEAGSLRGRVADAFEKRADINTIKAFGGSAGDIRALENNVAGGFRKVAQDVRGDLEAATGKRILSHSRESLHEYATARVEELGEKLGGMLRKLDESGAGIAPDAAAFARKVQEQIVAPNVVVDALGQRVIKPGQVEVVRAAESWLDEVAGAYGSKPPTFVEWQAARRGLDSKIKWSARNATPEEAALRKIRGIMEGELEATGELAAKNVGASFADEYRATKSLYQSVRQAEELTERGVSRQLVNNSFGLGATIGAATGVAAGGPVTGIAMGLAGKVVKDRGDMLAADLLSRAASMLGVQRLAGQTSARIAQGTAALTGTKAITAGVAHVPGPSRSVAAPLGVVLSGNQRKDFEKLSTATVSAASNPSHMAATIGAALGPEASKSPGLAAAVTNLMLGDVAYLKSKLPPSRADEFSLQPHLQGKSRASDTEISAFIRRAEVLANPTIVLDEARKGTLTREHVEALQERRPKLYEQMRLQVMEQLVTSTSPLPYDRRIQLGILLDIPTDRTLAPEFQRAIQATFSSAEEATAESPPKALARPLEIATAQATPLQLATSEGMDR